LRVIPVLDVMGGRVVRGVAGRRTEYRPIESVLTDSFDPLKVAEAIRAHFGLSALYVADLDAILKNSPNLDVFGSMTQAGFTLTVDTGLKCADDAAAVLAADVNQVVAGLETLAGPRELMRLIEQYGSSRVVFSLDLFEGRPLGQTANWRQAEPLAIAAEAIEVGCTKLIVLDIAHVGTAAGVGTLPLCAEIRRAYPLVTLFTGGGIRGRDDLQCLDQSVIDGVLIASALHNGSIRPTDLDSLLE
jgi:phosphoribosylformimino-5-aminoimidazole carboxamide ribotide isomerase